MDAREKEGLDHAKRTSALQLLFRVARRMNELGVERVRQTPGMENLRPAHTNLFPHIDLEGTRLTEIAGLAGISKQAVGPLVDELVEMGVVERIPDPRDGRAKLIRFAVHEGEHSILKGLAVLQSLEGEIASSLGAREIERFKKTLLRLEDWLDEETGPPRI